MEGSDAGRDVVAERVEEGVFEGAEGDVEHSCELVL